jgi:hypothetical protein
MRVTERRSILEMYPNEFRQVRGASKSETSKQLPPKKPEDAIAQSNRVAEIADALLEDFGEETPFPSAEEIKQKFESGIETASNGLFTARYALRSARAATEAIASRRGVSKMPATVALAGAPSP